MKTEKTFYTYFHTRNDTNAVFYVGKGHGKRAHDVSCRNQHWRNIVAKHSHTVHIAAHWPTEAEALQHEKFLILCFKDMGLKLANLTDGGEGTSGFKHSPESIAKTRAANVGRVVSKETREKLSAANTGYAHTDLAIAKIKAAGTGRLVSKETRSKISEKNKGRRLSDEARARLSARVITEETKAKISATLTGRTGRVVSAETRERQRQWNTGRVMSDEAKLNMRKAKLGRVLSDETKAKMSASQSDRWKRKREE